MLDAILSRYKKEPASLVMVLLDVQASYGYVPQDVMTEVARELDVPRAKVLSVATFYNALSLEPRGRHSIRVCMGTACHVLGSSQVLAAFARELDVEPGHTTKDGGFTLEAVRCIGCCGLAPVVEIDTEIHSFVSPDQVPKLVKQYHTGDGEVA